MPIANSGSEIPIIGLSDFLSSFIFHDGSWSKIMSSLSSRLYLSGAPDITPSFWWGSCYLFFSFLCCVIVCLFVFFIFSVVSLFSIYELTVSLVSFVPPLYIHDRLIFNVANTNLLLNSYT